MTGSEKEMRYPSTIGVRVSQEINDWIPKPRSENVRLILEWFHESYKDFNKILELIK